MARSSLPVNLDVAMLFPEIRQKAMRSMLSKERQRTQLALQ